MRKKVTIKDVASRAGVSPSTVSRAIYSTAKLKPETKERIFRAMEELGYYPNAAARALVHKRTMTLGVILPNGEDDLFLNPFFIHALRGLSIHAQSRGYFILYAFSNNEEEEISFIEELYRSRRIDGVVALTVRRNDACLAFMKQQQIPFVVIGHPEGLKGVLWVDNDNFQAMYRLVNWMVDKGYTELAFLGGPPELMVTQDRCAGFEQALRIRGLPLREGRVLYAKGFSEEEGYRCARELLSRDRTVDGILTTDDLLAIGVVRGIEDLGITRHIGVTGFNNTVQGQFHRPSLTTVDIHPYDLGYHAARLLIAHLDEEENVPPHFVVDTHIIPRETTRP